MGWGAGGNYWSMSYAGPRLQQTNCMLLPLSIDGTDRPTNGRTSGPDRCIDAYRTTMRPALIRNCRNHKQRRVICYPSYTECIENYYINFIPDTAINRNLSHSQMSTKAETASKQYTVFNINLNFWSQWKTDLGHGVEGVRCSAMQAQCSINQCCEDSWHEQLLYVCWMHIQLRPTAVLVLQPLTFGTLCLHLSLLVPPSVVTSRPTTANGPSNTLNPFLLAPQIRLLLIIVHVYKLYLLTYLR